MKVHELKVDPQVFEATWSAQKRCELRYDDRGFCAGDILHLRETRYSGLSMLEGAPLEYTGREVKVLVLHILQGPRYGLEDGWAMLSHTIPLATHCTPDADRYPITKDSTVKVEA